MYDVDVVAVPAQPQVVLGGPAPLAAIGERMRRVRELVAEAGLTPAGPIMGRYYEHDVSSPTLHYEVCLPVEPLADGSVPDEVGEARGEWVPHHHALQPVHWGPRDRMDDAVRALHEALEALGYTASGPLTEIYEKDTSSHASSGPVTTLRLPYAR